MSHSETESLSGPALLERLAIETTAALERVYTLDRATPVDEVTLESGCRLLLKREDTSTVHSYKWRGAVNKIASLVENGFAGSLVAASAGNHAQGVAVAAKAMRLKTTVFMPLSTPMVKQRAVKNLGGPWVEIRLHGDAFDDAAKEAKRFADAEGGEMIAPYDDLLVIAGQSTIGVELVNSLKQMPSHVFLPIGGGGMVAGVASVLKKAWPSAKLIGVEAVDQDSMGTSIGAGQRQTLSTIDRFCDGTAVATPGRLNYELCRQLIDEFVTVDNDHVCQAIQFLWQEMRIIVEPSAALGVAAARASSLGADDLALTVVSGSNVDFMTLPMIARRGQVDPPLQRFLSFELGEKPGQLIGILDHFFGQMNIIDFQYGKVHDKMAFPVIGIEVPQHEVDQLEGFLNDPAIPPYKDVTGTAAIDFRVIPFRADLLKDPFFAVIFFPNRPGALRDFMRGASTTANVCYMNYTDSGTEVGQALMGFEFDSDENRRQFTQWLEGYEFRFEAIPMETVKHLGQAIDSGIENFAADYVRQPKA